MNHFLYFLLVLPCIQMSAGLVNATAISISESSSVITSTAQGAAAARNEVENNHLGTGLNLFGLQIGTNQVEAFAQEMNNVCQAGQTECQAAYDRWRDLSYTQGGLTTDAEREGWEEFVVSTYLAEVYPRCNGDAACEGLVDANLAQAMVVYAGDAQDLRANVSGLLYTINAAERNYGHLAFQVMEDLGPIIPLFGMIGSGARVVRGVSSGAGATNNAAAGSVANANFAQSFIHSAEVFSAEGMARYSQLAGKPIRTVDDLAMAIQTGAIKPSQVPVDYVITSNGTRVILNTRTSVALNRAGIPQSQWYGVNQTGVQVPGMPTGITFNDLATRQLTRNGLPPTGTPNIPTGGKK